MKIIIVGLMQGNKQSGIHDQSYRSVIAEALRKVVKEVEIIDPDKDHPGRLTYTFQQSKDMFFDYVNWSTKVDLVIAYIPEASMGTAVEIWEAHKSNVPIITVSTLTTNWVIKLLSTEILPTIDSLLEYITTERFKENYIKE